VLQQREIDVPCYADDVVEYLDARRVQRHERALAENLLL